MRCGWCHQVVPSIDHVIECRKTGGQLGRDLLRKELQAQDDAMIAGLATLARIDDVNYTADRFVLKLSYRGDILDAMIRITSCLFDAGFLDVDIEPIGGLDVD